MSIKFDIRISTPTSFVSAGYFRSEDHRETVLSSTEEGKKLSVKLAHEVLGHSNEEATRTTAKRLGWEITRGKLGKCEDYTKGKGKQKNVTQQSRHVLADKPAKRIFLDVKSLREPKNKKETPFVSKPNMREMVDEHSGRGFLRWFETKIGIVEPTTELFHEWKQEGKSVEVMRCDNAGENQKLEERMKSWDWEIPAKFEYTARASNATAELFGGT